MSSDKEAVTDFAGDVQRLILMEADPAFALGAIDRRMQHHFGETEQMSNSASPGGTAWACSGPAGW